MADLRMTLLDLLNKSEQGADPSFLRDGVKLIAQELMDAKVTAMVGAEPHQRTLSRTTYRNGYREREWDTRVIQEAQLQPLRAHHLSELRPRLGPPSRSPPPLFLNWIYTTSRYVTAEGGAGSASANSFS